ncbi:hypothetical protein QSV34_06445 [Porticoccus sp. W117]|uniref:DUF2846 domain-containing protein n=1 Tax=Porticoccus sp. W117 TaxID=3054777 RepID=UPI002597E86F|nr:DUF2846 domain-containing protein [Porticoccus sp. W117]MDM3870992.1 hypothetical protein [Porticoccus sp. W117]
MKTQFLTGAIAAMLFAASVSSGVQAENTQSAIMAEEPNVVIYRPSQQAMLSYMDYRLYLNGKSLGKLAHGKRMELQLAPGHYQLIANDSAKSQLKFEVEAGKTTVVKTEVDSALCMPMSEMGSPVVASTSK